MPLSVATWNVNSVLARLPVVTRWLEKEKPSILCLQEIKCLSEKFPREEIEKAGYTSLIFGQPTYNGVAILVKNELAGTIQNIQKGFPGEGEEAQKRLIEATIAGVKIINVYIPNGQAVGTDKYRFKLDWLENLRDYFDKTAKPEEPVLLCGDFNVAPADLDVYDPKVWEGKILFSQPEKDALNKLAFWGLSDSFRVLYPDKVQYTWWDYRQASFRRNLGLRIDHIWVSKPLMGKCLEVRADLEPRREERPSDHTPLVASFDLV